MNFCDKLILIRKQKNLTQEELANQLNVSRQTISRWELGESHPDVVKLREIAILFGVTTDYLLLDSNQTLKKETDYSYTIINYNTKVNNNWLQIGFIGIIVGLIIPYVYPVNLNLYDEYNSDVYGIWIYLTAFLPHTKLWMVFTLTSISFFIFGIIQSFKTNSESRKRTFLRKIMHLFAWLILIMLLVIFIII